MKVLYLDVDGVLANFAHTAIAFHGKSLPPSEVTWDFPKQIGFSDTWVPEMWRPLGRAFWSSLPWTDEGKELLAAAERLFGENIALMTAPFGVDDEHLAECIAGKMAWIGRELPNYRKRCFVGAPKHLAAGPGKVLLDDYDGGTLAFSRAGGLGVTVPRPWNCMRHRTDNLGRFDVAEVVTTLEQIVAG